MFGANVGSKLAVALIFVPSLHFLYCVTDERAGSREHPTAFRAAVACKTLFLNPYQLAAMMGGFYTRILVLCSGV